MRDFGGLLGVVGRPILALGNQRIGRRELDGPGFGHGYRVWIARDGCPAVAFVMDTVLAVTPVLE